jgi:hypothetical protein
VALHVHVRLRWNDKLQDRTRLVTERCLCPKRLKALSIFVSPPSPIQVERLHAQSMQNSFDSVVALAGIDSVVTCPV